MAVSPSRELISPLPIVEDSSTSGEMSPLLRPGSSACGGRGSRLGGRNVFVMRRTPTAREGAHTPYDRTTPRDGGSSRVLVRITETTGSIGTVIICRQDSAHSHFHAQLSHGQGRLTPKGTVQVRIGETAFSERPLVNGVYNLCKTTFHDSETGKSTVKISLKKEAASGSICQICERPAIGSGAPFFGSSLYLL